MSSTIEFNAFEIWLELFRINHLDLSLESSDRGKDIEIDAYGSLVGGRLVVGCWVGRTFDASLLLYLKLIQHKILKIDKTSKNPRQIVSYNGLNELSEEVSVGLFVHSRLI